MLSVCKTERTHAFFLGLFRDSCCALKPKGKMFMYSPYTDNYKLTPTRNFDFDSNLKKLNAK